MKRSVKHSISAITLASFMFIAFGSMDDDKNESDSSSGGTSVNADASTTKKIGEILPTKYFDVTVNSVGVDDRVNTGNEFSNLPREEGTRYLVINTTFKNTSNESRAIFEGEVLINYNGQEYLYDKSEVVMAEGWGLLFDQINPLTSKTTNIVYKIPAEIKGVAYYRPGRSSKKDLIELGNIE